MAGVRRRLQQVSKTVSGVLGVRLGEAPAEPRDAAREPQPEPGEPAPAQQPDPEQQPDLEQQELGEVAVVAEAPGTAAAADSAAPALRDEGPESAPAGGVAVQHPGSAGQGDRADEPAAGPGAPEPAQVSEPDPVLAAAVDTARAAAVEVGRAAVGEHLGVEVEPVLLGTGGAVLTHSFASTDRAYVGWRWAVTLARAEGSDQVTVDEVVLLPGAGALLAPIWVPWSERVQPGDLSAGDVLPAPPDDERLVPAYAEPEAELADEVRWELGLGRPRVLSREGRAEAAQRWWEGELGPLAAVARQAPGRCGDCGFLVPLAGALRAAFGVCANAYAPDDGRVVALSHGCGAHSETVVDPSHLPTAGMAVRDEFELVPAQSGTAPDAVEGGPVEADPVEAAPVEAGPVESGALEGGAVDGGAAGDGPAADRAADEPVPSS